MWRHNQTHSHTYYCRPDQYAEIRRLKQELFQSQHRAEESKKKYLNQCNDLEKKLQDSKFENRNLTLELHENKVKLTDLKRKFDVKLQEKGIEIREFNREFGVKLHENEVKIGELNLEVNRLKCGKIDAEVKVITNLRETINKSDKMIRNIEYETGKQISEVVAAFRKLEQLQEFYTTNYGTIQSMQAENEKNRDELYHLKIANSNWQETTIELEANFNKSQELVKNITSKCFLQNHQISDLKSKNKFYEQKLNKVGSKFIEIQKTLNRPVTNAREEKLDELVEQIQRTLKEKLVVCIDDDDNEDEEGDMEV